MHTFGFSLHSSISGKKGFFLFYYEKPRFFFWQSINLYIQSPLIWIFKIRTFGSMACTKIYILMHRKQMRKELIACCLMDLVTNLWWDITRLQSFEEGLVTHDVTRDLGLNSLIQWTNSKSSYKRYSDYINPQESREYTLSITSEYQKQDTIHCSILTRYIGLPSPRHGCPIPAVRNPVSHWQLYPPGELTQRWLE